MALLSSKLNISLIGDAVSQDYACLFDLLGKLFPVNFSRSARRADEQWDGAIVLADDQAKATALIPQGVPTYMAFEARGRPIPSQSSVIRFGDCPGLEPYLR